MVEKAALPLRVFHPAVHLLHVIPLAYLLTLLLSQDPAILQVRVVEGEGAVYPAGSRATRGVTVQVTDETGKPVEAATISFRLPEEGPSGTFATRARTEIAVTRSDGRASVWGMQWNRTVGALELRITAVKGQTRAGTVCPQYLTGAPAASSPLARIGPGRGHKWVWISLAAGAIAAGAVGGAALRSKTGATPVAIGAQIGIPTISLGRP